MTPFIEKLIQYAILAGLVLWIGYCSIQKYDSLVKQEVTAEMLTQGAVEAQERSRVNTKADVSLADKRAVQSDSVRLAVQGARVKTEESLNAKESWFDLPDPTWVRVFNEVVRLGR